MAFENLNFVETVFRLLFTVESVQRDVGLKGQIGQKSVYKDNFFF